MKTMKRWLMTVCFVFAMAMIFHGNVQAEEMTSLQEDTEYIVSSEDDNLADEYYFTPAKTSVYQIYSYFLEEEEGCDPFINVFDTIPESEDSDGFKGYDDDGGNGLNFSLEVSLTAGRTYKLCLGNYSSEFIYGMKIVDKAVGLLDKAVQISGNELYDAIDNLDENGTSAYLFTPSENGMYECSMDYSYTIANWDSYLSVYHISDAGVEKINKFNLDDSMEFGLEKGERYLAVFDLYVYMEDSENTYCKFEFLSMKDRFENYLKNAKTVKEGGIVKVQGTAASLKDTCYLFTPTENAFYRLEYEFATNTESEVAFNLYKVDGDNFRKLDGFTCWNDFGDSSSCGLTEEKLEAGNSYLFVVRNAYINVDSEEEIDFSFNIYNEIKRTIENSIKIEVGKESFVPVEAGENGQYLYLHADKDAILRMSYNNVKDYVYMMQQSVVDGYFEDEDSYGLDDSGMVYMSVREGQDYLIYLETYIDPWYWDEETGEEYEREVEPYSFSVLFEDKSDALISNMIPIEKNKEEEYEITPSDVDKSYLFTPEEDGSYKVMIYGNGNSLQVYRVDSSGETVFDRISDWPHYGGSHDVDNRVYVVDLEAGNHYLIVPNYCSLCPENRIMVTRFYPEMEDQYSSYPFVDRYGEAANGLNDIYYQEFETQVEKNTGDSSLTSELADNWNNFWRGFWKGLFGNYRSSASANAMGDTGYDDDDWDDDWDDWEDYRVAQENSIDDEEENAGGYGLLKSWRGFWDEFWNSLVEAPAENADGDAEVNKYSIVNRVKHAILARLNDEENMGEEFEQAEADLHDAFWTSFWNNAKDEIKGDYDPNVGKPVFHWDGENCTVTVDGEELGDVIITSKVIDEATCIDEGSMKVTATVTYDGKEYSSVNTVAIAKVDHTWKFDKVTVKPTEETEGEKRFVCTVCDEYKFEIMPKLNYNLEETCTVTLSQSTFTENGTERTPAVYVKTIDTQKKLVKNTDFEVSYSNNVEPGIATATVTGIGAYSGTLTADYTIRPTGTSLVEVINPSKKNLQITWNINPDVDGYEIKYSTQSTFADASTKAIAGNNVNTYKLSNRTIGKRYYVRVRTYKVVNGQNVYSVWSEYKSAYIVPPVEDFLAANLASKTLNAQWTACNYQEVEGYDITAYSDEELTKIAKKFDITDLNENTLAWTGRTLGKTYYIRIRTYVTNPLDNTKIYSNWSEVVPVKIVK